MATLTIVYTATPGAEPQVATTRGGTVLPLDADRSLYVGPLRAGSGVAELCVGPVDTDPDQVWQDATLPNAQLYVGEALVLPDGATLTLTAIEA